MLGKIFVFGAIIFATATVVTAVVFIASFISAHLDEHVVLTKSEPQIVSSLAISTVRNGEPPYTITSIMVDGNHVGRFEYDDVICVVLSHDSAPKRYEMSCVHK